jgi:hypothetical protein
MEPNTHSVPLPTGLGRLTAAVEELAAEDLTRLPDGEAAARVLLLRRLLDRLEGQWLRELAGVDGRGAAGADQGTSADSTAGWLRGRLRAGHPQASGWVRTARALYRGSLGGTGQALAAGELSVAHAAVLAAGTADLPPGTAAKAEPVLLEAARRLDPPRLRRVVAHLHEIADPDAADTRAQRQHERRGLWVSPTLAGMVAVDGLLEPEAGETLLTALEPLARPRSAEDDRSGAQRRADALTELARRALEGGRLPHNGGVRPQVTVTVELASLLGHPGLPGGEGGWVGPLPAETARRLACDAAVTRVLVTRHPTQDPDRGDHQHTAQPDNATGSLAARLRAAMALLPPALVGRPPSRWRLAAPPAWSPPPSGRRWRSATAAAWSQAATGHRPGVRPIICDTGSTAAPPTWATWCCCAAPTTAPSTKAASGCTHHTDNNPRPEPRPAGEIGYSPHDRTCAQRHRRLVPIRTGWPTDRTRDEEVTRVLRLGRPWSPTTGGRMGAAGPWCRSGGQRALRGAQRGRAGRGSPAASDSAGINSAARCGVAAGGRVDRGVGRAGVVRRRARVGPNSTTGTSGTTTHPDQRPQGNRAQSAVAAKGLGYGEVRIGEGGQSHRWRTAALLAPPRAIDKAWAAVRRGLPSGGWSYPPAVSSGSGRRWTSTSNRLSLRSRSRVVAEAERPVTRPTASTATATISASARRRIGRPECPMRSLCGTAWSRGIAAPGLARRRDQRRLGPLGALVVLGEQLLDQRAAAAAGDPGAAEAADLVEVAGPRLDRLADLPVGDGTAMADEHRADFRLP